MRLVEFSQKQITYTTENQMTADRLVLAHLEVVQPQFPLAVLEHPFDLPAGEGHQEQRFHRRVLGRVA